MKKRVLILLFLVMIVSIGFIFAADLAGENLPSTCDGTSCKPNPNYDANKPTNAGKVMGFQKADYVTLEKGDGALIEKETREIEINKEQKVTIKGIEYNLPSKAKIKFVKENNVEKTIITLPDGTSVTDPKVVDKEMAKDAVFEIKAESGKLKIGKDNFDGTVSFEVDKDGNLHEYLTDEKCSLGGLAITQKKGEKTEIFSDGELHPDAKGAYLSVGDKSVAIGKNSEGKGPEVKFEPGNRFLDKITSDQNVVMSAGRDADDKNNAAAGTIKITNRGDSAPEVAVDKSFTIKNGQFEMNTGKTEKGKEGFLIKVDERLGKSYAIEITNEKEFNFAGKKYKYVIDSNNKLEVVPLEREPIKFDTDLKTPGREVFMSWEQLSPLLPRVNLGGQAEKPQTKEDTNPFLKNLANTNVPVKNPQYSNPKTIYEEILGHDRPGRKIYSRSEGGQLTTMHEGDHGANQNHADESYTFYELGQGDKGTYLKEPGVTKTAIYSNYLPNEFTGNIYTEEYFLDRQFPDKPKYSNYMYDEWTATINSWTGALQLIDMDKAAGSKGTIWTTATPGNGPAPDLGEITSFTMNALSTATAVRSQKPTFFNDDAKYRQFVAARLIQAKQLYDSANSPAYGGYFSNSAQSYWHTLATSNDPKVDNMRQTARALIGSERTRTLFGF